MTNLSIVFFCLFESSRGGVNRSATVVLAYLMKYHSMSLRDAWDFVRSRRPQVQPVNDYMHQLRLYEESIFGAISLDEQSVSGPLSLNQRIGAWRDMNRKNGSMPADLASSRGSDEDTDEDACPSDFAPRANTSPIIGLKRPPKPVEEEKECSPPTSPRLSTKADTNL
jgi:hypothetical protein